MPPLQPKLLTGRSQHFKRHQSAVQGFSLYRLDALQAKESNNPPKRATGPSQFSECQYPMVLIPFVMATGPPGVHIMRSLKPEVPVSTSQHLKCHQVILQALSLYPLHALQPKEGNHPPKRGTCPPQLSKCQCPMVPISFGVAAPAPGVYIMPSLQPKLPLSRSQHFKRHQSAGQGFSLYPLDALQEKKGNNPPKRRTPASQFLECPPPVVPIRFAVDAARPGVHIMPSLQPELPIRRSQHFKCHHSAVRGFPLYRLDALQAKKAGRVGR